jgi:hypothetical protein
MMAIGACGKADSPIVNDLLDAPNPAGAARTELGHRRRALDRERLHRVELLPERGGNLRSSLPLWAEFERLSCARMTLVAGTLGS